MVFWLGKDRRAFLQLHASTLQSCWLLTVGTTTSLLYSYAIPIRFFSPLFFFANLPKSVNCLPDSCTSWLGLLSPLLHYFASLHSFINSANLSDYIPFPIWHRLSTLEACAVTYTCNNSSIYLQYHCLQLRGKSSERQHFKGLIFVCHLVLEHANFLCIVCR